MWFISHYMYKPDALADFAGNIWIWVPSRICHPPDVKQLASNLNDQLCQRNESDCIKGTERGLQKKRGLKKSTQFIFIYVHNGCLPQRATERTKSNWNIQLILQIIG